MYNEFAGVYDKLIETDYDAFVSFYKQVFDKFGISPTLICDLGCGTGTLTALMQKEGYDMIGIDSSPEMLSVAKENHPEILFINQSICEFELYGTVDAAYSSLDCINYLLEDDELYRHFSLINNYLNPGGIYIFDISSYYKLSQILGDNTFVYETDDIFYTWENSFEDDIVQMDLTFFKKCGNLYERFEEQQLQRAYKNDEIINAAASSGLTLLGVYDNLTFECANNQSERIFFVFRK